MGNTSYPDFDTLLEMIGQAGYRMAEIGASEGAAGNISVCLRWPVEVQPLFPVMAEVELPQPVPELGGATLVVSGSGCRLREILAEPAAHLACLQVNKDGKNGILCTSYQRRFEHITSEFNSHLAVHYDQFCSADTNFHALIHAQPVHLTYLSHIPRYQNAQYLNTHLLRWQPETIINLPEGVGVIPFLVPGSPDLMFSTVESLRKHRVVVWAKHGVMARSSISIMRAADFIEYAEAAAQYEFLNLAAGESAEGLQPEEIREICAAFKIDQDIF